MSLGLKETTRNDSKSNFITAQNHCIHDQIESKKFQDANVVDQGSNKRLEVNREEEVPGPPLNLRSFT